MALFFSLIVKPEIPTLKNLAAKALSNLILNSVKVAAAAVPYWQQEKWLEAKRYLFMPIKCMETLGSFFASSGPLSSAIRSLSAGQIFLVWWLLILPYVSLPDIVWDEVAVEFSQQMVHFLSLSGLATLPEASKDTTLQMPSLYLALPWRPASVTQTYLNNMAATLRKHPELKSLTIHGTVGAAVLKVISEHCNGKNLRELVFYEYWSSSTPLASQVVKPLLPLLFRLSESLTNLCLYGINYPHLLKQMMPAFQTCNNLKKLVLISIHLVEDEWEEEEKLPTVRHFTLEAFTSDAAGNDSVSALTAIAKVFPNLVNLNLQNMSLSSMESLVALSSLGHCLKELTGNVIQLHLSQVLKNCPNITKLNLYSPRGTEIMLPLPGEAVDFSLPLLREFRLNRLDTIRYGDLLRIIKGSPKLKIFTMLVKNIEDFGQQEFVKMVVEKRVLKHLEIVKLNIMEESVVSEQLLKALMSLPTIRVVGYVPLSLMEDVAAKDRVLAVAKAKGLEIKFV